MPEAIVVTGGTGKTGRALVAQLRDRGLRPRIASRHPRGVDDVRFDWKDPATFEDTFRQADAAYLVAPTDDFNSLGATQAGLEFAVRAGVRRFVLLSASSLAEGGPMMGEVHAWLRANTPEWRVLRPSWFMQNFSESHHLQTILEESKIYTATGNGRVGFIDAGDIARCAAALLTEPDGKNTDYVLTGPDVLSYDMVAEFLSQHLNRTVLHEGLDTGALSERFMRQGMPREYADALARMDADIAAGSEDRVTRNVQIITAQPATSFDAFVRLNIGAWAVNAPS